eukprot:CAMPEP_0203817752 /NCGR_PEP_ID=MMETSP0115-20131106/27992_1 /ASSEMBLY_ACC=CAM_ASM_000227 /TAXON_ID=33651 /ORGANISM="Bicosoecid sp, Strain ms1" /LENGTH=57 /DNA_ID=CAMNT_0050726691 /DNA_START=37 /DNA_END=207 /DNA_ORIENTATION=+
MAAAAAPAETAMAVTATGERVPTAPEEVDGAWLSEALGIDVRVSSARAATDAWHMGR